MIKPADLTVVCPVCTAAVGTPCFFDAIERLGADGKMRDRKGDVHSQRAINARKETP